MLKVLPFLVFLLLVSSILILNSGKFNPSNTQISLKSGVPSWGDGTDAFYKQLLTSTGEFEENAPQAIFDNQPVDPISKKETEDILVKAREQQKLASGDSTTQVLGLHTAPDGAEKWVEVDLSDKKLYAWEGDRKIYEFLISTGRPGYETPTGDYRVWRKVRSQRYKGGTPGTSGYYDLPNVPYSLFFGSNRLDKWKGYALHGAYWHNDFGIKNRSSGCVNLAPMDAGRLYSWAGPVMPEGTGAVNSTDDNPGIRVVIHE